MKKSKLMPIVAILLVAIAAGLVFLPKYLNKNNREVAGEVQVELSSITENLRKDAEFNYDEINQITDYSEDKKDQSVIDGSRIGQIWIPSLDINLPILKGVTNEILWNGVGTMLPEQAMGYLNYPLVSHKVFTHGIGNVLFTNLDQIKNGEIVKLTDANKVYEYKIYETKIVQETEVGIAELYNKGPNEKAMVTLITCVSLNGDKRFVAFAELSNEYDYTDMPAFLAK